MASGCNFYCLSPKQKVTTLYVSPLIPISFVSTFTFFCVANFIFPFTLSSLSLLIFWAITSPFDGNSSSLHRYLTFFYPKYIFPYSVFLSIIFSINHLFKAFFTKYHYRTNFCLLFYSAGLLVGTFWRCQIRRAPPKIFFALTTRKLR